jgi:hypothetical protein
VEVAIRDAAKAQAQAQAQDNAALDQDPMQPSVA